MKKVLWIVIVIILLAIGGGVYYVLTHLDSLVKQAIEKYGSQATHTAVRVRGVHIKLKQAEATISGLTVANPTGFNTPNAFSLGQITTRLDLKKTNQHNIVIDEVRIQTPEVFYEMNADRQGNLNQLKERLAGQGKVATGKPAAPSSTAPPTISIRKFAFSGAALHVLLVPLKNKQYNLHIPSFTLSQLHGTPQQISKQVLNQLIDHARDEIRRKGIDAELDKARARLKQKLETEKAKVKQKADTRLEEEKTKAQNKLKQLFGK